MIRPARLFGLAVTLATVAPALSPRAACADESDAPKPPPVEKPEGDPFETKDGYFQLFATAAMGEGLRFNNPYRLRTPLGDDAQSVSRTAPYLDFGLGATFGNPLGFQHGLALRVSAATSGVSQMTMTPSYMLWRRWHSIGVHGRAGASIVLSPDVTWGLEAAAGASWFFLGGFGVFGEVVGDVFYGAGTRDVATASYPVLSGQLGLIAAWEVLP